MDREYEVGQMPPRREEFADRPPSPYCPHFIEKLLLAIIDAHPQEAAKWSSKDNPELARQIRLGQAMKALLGVPPPPKPRAHYDLPTLIDVARELRVREEYREYQADLIKPDTEPVEIDAFMAVLKKAEGAAKWDGDLQAKYVRLKDVYDNDEAFRSYALDVLGPWNEDHPEETAMIEDLANVRELLEKWHVAMVVEPENLGMMSLTKARADDPFDASQKAVR